MLVLLSIYIYFFFDESKPYTSIAIPYMSVAFEFLCIIKTTYYIILKLVFEGQ